MARAKFIDDPAFELTLQRAGAAFPHVAEAALRAGAGVLANEMRRTLAGKLSKKATGELLGSMGITPVKVDPAGDYNAHIGFEGYNTKKRPFQVIARSLEGGWRYDTVTKNGLETKKHAGLHFARDAKKAAMPAAIAEMNRVAEAELEKLTKNL